MYENREAALRLAIRAQRLARISITLAVVGFVLAVAAILA